MDPDSKVQTRYGEVLVWGRRTDPGRPALFAVGGMFPPKNQLAYLHAALPDYDVVRVQLPGMRESPPLSRGGMGALGQALADVLDQVFPRQVVTGFGVSTGCLALLATHHYAPRIERMVLVEPFLQPANTWPMVQILHDYLPKFGPEMQVWAREMMGHGRAGIDYTPLLAELAPRTEVILGGVPLGNPRNIRRVPSFGSEAERKMWRARPGVRMSEVPGFGHAIPDDLLGAAVAEALID